MNVITHHFNKAALHYDQAASVQAQVAKHLVDWAASSSLRPHTLLDVGCGTGFVAAALSRQWPSASITALDHAPAMLSQAQHKVPHLKKMIGDAARLAMPQRFDGIFSSMMLHWLLEPDEVLRRWQGWLKPGGRLYVALLTEGSFQEWREACQGAGITDGLWVMPSPDLADGNAFRRKQQALVVDYSSAHDFLCRLRTIGATTPRQGHRPISPSVMRSVLRRAPQPFTITYQILYIEIQSPDSV